MITIILGMHRSGTSALAGLLHSNGIVMGREKDFYPPPMKENPKGFYENVRFRRINDAILKQVGYKVKSFNPTIPIVPIVRGDNKLRKLMRDLLKDYDSEYKDWGWKDPRTSLTFSSWFDVMRELELTKNIRCILMLRPAKDVSMSMQMRGNKENQKNQFMILSIEYVTRAIESLNEHIDIPMMPVMFEDLICKTQMVANKLMDFLETGLYDISFVDPDIARTVA